MIRIVPRPPYRPVITQFLSNHLLSISGLVTGFLVLRCLFIGVRKLFCRGAGSSPSIELLTLNQITTIRGSKPARSSISKMSQPLPGAGPLHMSSPPLIPIPRVMPQNTSRIRLSRPSRAYGPTREPRLALSSARSMKRNGTATTRPEAKPKERAVQAKQVALGTVGSRKVPQR